MSVTPRASILRRLRRRTQPSFLGSCYGSCLALQKLLRVMAGNLAVVEQAQYRFVCAAQLGRIRAALVKGAT